MACHRTKPAWTAKNGITFRAQDRKPDYYVPCGKCLGCKADQARDWAIRIEHEARLHDQKCFLTLTYSDEYLPADRKIDRELLTKKMKELQRKLDIGLRYFAVGEYGDKTRRPHYHAVLYGTDLLGGSSSTRGDKYIHPAISGLWPYGNHEIQPYDDGTAVYTAGYVSKKIGDPECFSIKSTRPPLGKAYCIKDAERILANGTAIINGTELPVPKVYVKWLEQNGYQVEQLKEKIREAGRRKAPITDRRGQAKDINAKAKLQRKGEVI